MNFQQLTTSTYFDRDETITYEKDGFVQYYNGKMLILDDVQEEIELLTHEKDCDHFIVVTDEGEYEYGLDEDVTILVYGVVKTI